MARQSRRGLLYRSDTLADCGANLWPFPAFVCRLSCELHAFITFANYQQFLGRTDRQLVLKDERRLYLVNDNLSLHWTPQIRAWAEAHNVELVATPTSASHLNRIECHFRPLRECVLNASDYASHAEVALAFRRYLRRRNADHHSSRIRLLESRSRVA